MPRSRPPKGEHKNRGWSADPKSHKPRIHLTKIKITGGEHAGKYGVIVKIGKNVLTVRLPDGSLVFVRSNKTEVL